MRKWSLVFTILSVFLAGLVGGWAACAPIRLNDGLDAEDVDGGTMLPPGTQTCGSDAECGSGRRCVDNRCVPDNGTCMPGSSDADTCQGDTYCACPPEVKATGCVCLPWGTKPRGDHEPSLEALRHQLEPIYKAFEARCPQLFRPACTVPAYGQRVVSAYYMETGISLNVVQKKITYYAERQPVDTFIGNVDDVPRVVERFDCKRPRDGSREF